MRISSTYKVPATADSGEDRTLIHGWIEGGMEEMSRREGREVRRSQWSATRSISANATCPEHRDSPGTMITRLAARCDVLEWRSQQTA